MTQTAVNDGDMRTTVDIEHLASVSSVQLAEKVKKIINSSKIRTATFYILSENEKFVTVHLATGFYMEKHDKTVHTEIHYLQYSKADGLIYQCEFDTHSLRNFAPIGIAYND